MLPTKQRTKLVQCEHCYTVCGMRRRMAVRDRNAGTIKYLGYICKHCRWSFRDNHVGLIDLQYPKTLFASTFGMQLKNANTAPGTEFQIISEQIYMTF